MLLTLILLLLHFPAYHWRDIVKFGFISVTVVLYVISSTHYGAFDQTLALKSIEEYFFLLLHIIMTTCLHLHISKVTLPIFHLADFQRSPSQIFSIFYFVPITCFCMIYWVCYSIILNTSVI